MGLEIKNDLLVGDNVKYIKSPTHGGEFKAGDLDTVIIHFTAGPINAAINTFSNAKNKVSAHLVVGRDGSIVQMVPFNIVGWHAGESSYNGRTGFNQYSLGIEIENAGEVTKSGNVFRAWYGSSFDASDVIEATHRNQHAPKFWHAYTEEQIQTVFDICQKLIDQYDIKFILGHEEIAPARKTDPGPAFPLDRMRDRLLSGDRDKDEPERNPTAGVVAASKLNIRMSPNETADKVTNPLQQGAKVVVLEEKNGWYKVRTEVEGWVMAKFIENQK